MGNKWIAGATSNSHGQFRAKAKKAGMSTAAYASKEANAPGKTGKQARLAQTLMGLNKGKKKSAASNPFFNASKNAGGGF